MNHTKITVIILFHNVFDLGLKSKNFSVMVMSIQRLQRF